MNSFDTSITEDATDSMAETQISRLEFFKKKKERKVNI